MHFLLIKAHTIESKAFSKSISDLIYAFHQIIQENAACLKGKESTIHFLLELNNVNELLYLCNLLDTSLSWIMN